MNLVAAVGQSSERWTRAGSSGGVLDPDPLPHVLAAAVPARGVRGGLARRLLVPVGARVVDHQRGRRAPCTLNADRGGETRARPPDALMIICDVVTISPHPTQVSPSPAPLHARAMSSCGKTSIAELVLNQETRDSLVHGGASIRPWARFPWAQRLRGHSFLAAQRRPRPWPR
jgi:hypothetical protein